MLYNVACRFDPILYPLKISGSVPVCECTDPRRLRGHYPLFSFLLILPRANGKPFPPTHTLSATCQWYTLSRPHTLSTTCQWKTPFPAPGLRRGERQPEVPQDARGAVREARRRAAAGDSRAAPRRAQPHPHDLDAVDVLRAAAAPHRGSCARYERPMPTGLLRKVREAMPTAAASHRAPAQGTRSHAYRAPAQGMRAMPTSAASHRAPAQGTRSPCLPGSCTRYEKPCRQPQHLTGLLRKVRKAMPTAAASHWASAQGTRSHAYRAPAQGMKAMPTAAALNRASAQGTKSHAYSRSVSPGSCARYESHVYSRSVSLGFCARYEKPCRQSQHFTRLLCKVREAMPTAATSQRASAQGTRTHAYSHSVSPGFCTTYEKPCLVFWRPSIKTGTASSMRCES